MNRPLVLLLALCSCLPAGCGRGAEVVVEPKPPTVEAKAPIEQIQPETAEKKAERLQSYRESAEKIEKTARDENPLGNNRKFSINMMWAATAWLKAEDHDKARAAAKAAIAAGPDDSTPVDTFKWHANIADVLAATGEIPLAIEHYEAALKAAPDPVGAARTQKKLDETKVKLGKSK